MKIKKINEFLEKMDHISKNANIVKTKDCISYTFENVMITVYECNRIAFHINNFYACFETENLISMVHIENGFTIQFKPIYSTLVINFKEGKK